MKGQTLDDFRNNHNSHPGYMPEPALRGSLAHTALEPSAASSNIGTYSFVTVFAVAIAAAFCCRRKSHKENSYF